MTGGGGLVAAAPATNTYLVAILITQ